MKTAMPCLGLALTLLIPVRAQPRGSQKIERFFQRFSRNKSQSKGPDVSNFLELHGQKCKIRVGYHPDDPTSGIVIFTTKPPKSLYAAKSAYEAMNLRVLMIDFGKRGGELMAEHPPPVTHVSPTPAEWVRIKRAMRPSLTPKEWQIVEQLGVDEPPGPGKK